MQNIEIFFFFFQAEDGIRDKLVTGVQTCALPILQMRLGEPAAVPLPGLLSPPNVVSLPIWRICTAAGSPRRTPRGHAARRRHRRQWRGARFFGGGRGNQIGRGGGSNL